METFTEYWLKTYDLILLRYLTGSKKFGINFFLLYKSYVSPIIYGELFFLILTQVSVNLCIYVIDVEMTID